MPHHAAVFGGEEFSKFERNAIQSADAENALQGSGKVHVTVANMLFCVVFIASFSFVKSTEFLWILIYNDMRMHWLHNELDWISWKHVNQSHWKLKKEMQNSFPCSPFGKNILLRVR